MWRLEFERSFQKSFRGLHPQTQNQIADFLEELQNNPCNPNELPNFQYLTNRPNQGRIRIGKYRIGVTIDLKEEIIFFNFVGSRGDFYKQFR
ncbi:MAG: type II toxin-antitoxin system RelE/ParE family toxin [Magnetococcales bacterium]|nr:type II toxin-antitoxin system RelE/ParE family toxin [Magnetococcales bacterium]